MSRWSSKSRVKSCSEVGSEAERGRSQYAGMAGCGGRENPGLTTLPTTAIRLSIRSSTVSGFLRTMSLSALFLHLRFVSSSLTALAVGVNLIPSSALYFPSASNGLWRIETSLLIVESASRRVARIVSTSVCFKTVAEGSPACFESGLSRIAAIPFCVSECAPSWMIEEAGSCQRKDRPARPVSCESNTRTWTTISPESRKRARSSKPAMAP